MREQIAHNILIIHNHTQYILYNNNSVQTFKRHILETLCPYYTIPLFLEIFNGGPSHHISQVDLFEHRIGDGSLRRWFWKLMNWDDIIIVFIVLRICRICSFGRWKIPLKWMRHGWVSEWMVGLSLSKYTTCRLLGHWTSCILYTTSLRIFTITNGPWNLWDFPRHSGMQPDIVSNF